MEEKRLKQLARGLEKTLFDKQVEFLEGKGKKKLARCSRRAGKSSSIAIALTCCAARNPGLILPYITMSIKNSKRIIWPPLKEIESEWAFGMRFKENDFTVTFPNGSVIVLGGCQSVEEIEKFRGPKYKLATIDEAQSIRTSLLKPLVEDILEPATLDLDGEIWLTGTPGANASGYFYDADQKEPSPWELFHWTLLENPYLNNAEEWLSKKKTENAWTEKTPVYVREYLGQWVRDEEALVYAYAPDRNLVKEGPTDFDCVLGVDLGFDDPTAFVVIAWEPNRPTAFVIHVEKHSGMTSSDIGKRIVQLNDRFDFLRIVADTGALGKMIVKELNQRYSLSIESAEKAQKLAHIELLNSDLKNSLLVLVEGEETEELADEYELLEWDAVEKTKGRMIERVDCDNHATDATLYAWREALHWLHRKPVGSPDVGTPEYYERLEAEMEAEAEAESERLNSAVEDEDYFDQQGWEPI